MRRLQNWMAEYLNYSIGIRYDVDDEGMVHIPVWISWGNQDRDPTA